MADLNVVEFPLSDEAKLRAQTFLEFLEEFVAEVRAGRVAPTGCMIFYLDAQNRPHIWHKNTSTLEQIAYAQLASQMALEHWRGRE